MALTPVGWLSNLMSGIASASARGHCQRLEYQLAQAQEHILMLERDLQIKTHQVEACEVQVEMLRAAHADNMILLDHMAVTHGVNSPKS